MKNAMTILLAAVLATACQTSNYYGTVEAFSPPSPLGKVLVDEASSAITRAFPPGKTTFYFPHQKEKFAIDLESRLRRAGYAFRSEKPTGDMVRNVTEIGYKLGGVSGDDSLIILRLVAGDRWQMSRVYQRLKDGSIQSSGPLLIRKG